MSLLTLLALSCVACGEWPTHVNVRLEGKVAFWFLDQSAQWSVVVERCQTAILLFTDREWLSLTHDLMRELDRFGHGRCIALWYWMRPNETLAWPTQRGREFDRPFMIDTYTSASADSAWGTPAYFSKIADRIPIAIALLKHLNARVGLAMFDSDVTIQRNVVTRMERLPAALAIQTEVVCSGGRPRCANGGFWRVHNSDAARTLLLSVNDVMLDLRVPDQEAFDIVLALARHSGVPRAHVTYLDPLLYATGYVVQHNDTWDFTRSYMLHANWCISLACKRAFLHDARRGRFDTIRQRFRNKKSYH